MVVLMGFNAFGTRLQSLWIMFFFCQKRFSLWSEKPNADKILFRQLRFSPFSSARYFDMSPQVFVRAFSQQVTTRLTLCYFVSTDNTWILGTH